MASVFDEQLDLLLKFSPWLRKQGALSGELFLAESTVSGWRKRGLPDEQRQAVAKVARIPAEWFDEPIERFRNLVKAKFRPIELFERGEESKLMKFEPARPRRAAVPGAWPARPQLKVNSEHRLRIDVAGIFRELGLAVAEIVVLSRVPRGIVVLRPSSISTRPVQRDSDLVVPDVAEQVLRIDAVGAGQSVLAICLQQALPEPVRQQLLKLSSAYTDEAELVGLSEAMALQAVPPVLLKHTVDVVDIG